MKAKEFRELRLRSRMTQGQLAEAIGMSRAMVNHMESGRNPIMKTTELALRYVALCASE